MNIPDCKIVITDLDRTLSRVNLNQVLFKKVDLYTKIQCIKNYLYKGKAYACYELSSYADLLGDELYINYKVLGLLHERSKSAQIILATGSPLSLALYVANKLKIFNKVIASDESTLVIGQSKAEKIKELIGNNDFLYIGDSMQDVPIWQIARWQAVVLQGSNIRHILKWKEQFKDLYII